MATEITTTLVVNFRGGDASDGVLRAEIDGRADGLNLGQTRFGAGSSPGFLIYKSSNVTLTSITPSTGSISNEGSFDVEQEETLNFAKDQQASVQRPIKNGVLTSFKWLGTDLGTPVVNDETTISVPSVGVGVLKITYDSIAIGRRLNGVAVPLNGETEFPVLILIEGQVN